MHYRMDQGLLVWVVGFSSSYNVCKYRRVVVLVTIPNIIFSLFHSSVSIYKMPTSLPNVKKLLQKALDGEK